MSTQKDDVMQFIEEQRLLGRCIGEILMTLGIKRATYYRWKNVDGQQTSSVRGALPLTPEECKRIDDVKETHPEYRHRRIQGVLQAQGFYLSSSAI